MSPPFFSRRSISSRWDCNRVTSSATSIRMAKAVASDRARSWAASGDALEPSVRPMASFQRSRKRWRCCSTSLGTSGTACWARLRSCARWPWSMVARRAPSWARASSNAARACSASSRAVGLQSSSAGPECTDSRSTSATDRGVAWGNQERMVSCAAFRRCNRRGEGSGTLVVSVLSRVARTSTLPRLIWLVSRLRREGSRARSSSGRRKARSRNRLLTDRISNPRRRVDAARPSVAGAVAAPAACALAYPVML